MEEKKPSTADILAKIRAQKAAAAGGTPAPAPEAAAPAAEPAPPVAAAAPVESPAKPVAPAAKPGSTADILAAIRAKKGGAAAPAPAAAAPAAATPAAAATTAAATPAAAGPAKPLPSIAEMVRAAKPGVAAPAPVAKVPTVAPPMPAKPVPAAAKKKGAPAPSRRSLAAIVTVTLASLASLVLGTLLSSPLLIIVGVCIWGALLSPFAMAWTAIAGVTGIATLGVARFMFPNVLVEPPSKFKIGPPSDYPLNAVSNKWKDQFGVWIVHTDQYEGKDLIYALSTVCTHLGCTPSWLDGEQKFKCPCHGSGFYITGVNFEGPAPRPLERVGLRVAEDGMLEVNKSMKFQEEMGQWVDASSYVDGSLA